MARVSERIRKISLFSILGLALVLAAPAQDVRFSAGLTPSVFVQPAQGEPLAFAGLRGTGAVQGYLGDALAYTVSAETYLNAAGLADAVDWNYSWDGRLLSVSLMGNSRLSGTLELKEAWVEASLGDLDLRIGKQITAWGLADGNNPTDTLNARHLGTRYTTTLDEQKIAVWMLNGTWYLPNNLGTVQGLIIPVSIPNDLPSLAMTIPAGPTTITIQEDAYPELSFENLEGGLRGLFYLGNLSFSASYFTYMDRYPDFTVYVDNGPPTVITYTPVHNRIHQIGLDASYFAGGFDIRTEWAVNLTKDFDGESPVEKNPYILGVIQASRSFFNSTTTLSLAWSPRVVLNYKAPSDYLIPSDEQSAEMIRKYDGQAYPWENALSFRAAGKYWNETLQPELLFLAETGARDWFGTLSIAYQLSDGVSIKAGTAQYGSFLKSGDPDRELGTFSKSTAIDNDYYYIEVKISF